MVFHIKLHIGTRQFEYMSPTARYISTFDDRVKVLSRKLTSLYGDVHELRQKETPSPAAAGNEVQVEVSPGKKRG